MKKAQYILIKKDMTTENFSSKNDLDKAFYQEYGYYPTKPNNAHLELLGMFYYSGK